MFHCSYGQAVLTLCAFSFTTDACMVPSGNWTLRTMLQNGTYQSVSPASGPFTNSAGNYVEVTCISPVSIVVIECQTDGTFYPSFNFNCTNPLTSTTTTTTTTTTAPSTTTTSQPSPQASQIAASLQNGGTQQLMQTLFPQTISDGSISKTSGSDLLKVCNDFEPFRASPPPTAAGSITNVSVAFAINRINGIDTISQTIAASALLMLTWQVSSCPVFTTDKLTGRTEEQLLIAGPDEVWTPAFRFIESNSGNIYMHDAEERFGEDLIATQTIDASKPNRTLSFFWIKDGIYVSSCTLDLKKFPFDVQTCGFIFSLLRSTQIVSFVNPDFLISDAPVDDWNLIDQDYSLTTLRYKGLPTSTVIFAVKLRRNPIWFINNLIIPSAVLMLVELASFILPPDLPDRPALSTTILLAITVAQSTVTGQVPKTSQRILLADYISALLWLGVACTIYQLVACFLANIFSVEETKKESIRCAKMGGPPRIGDLVAAVIACTAYAGIHAYGAVVAFN